MTTNYYFNLLARVILVIESVLKKGSPQKINGEKYHLAYTSFFVIVDW